MNTTPNLLLFVLLGAIAVGMTLRVLLFFRDLARGRGDLEGKDH